MRRLSSLFLFVAMLLPAGCGGGSGGAAIGSLVALPQSASVRVMLASEPSGSDEGVYVTYTKVSLCPDDGGDPVALFESVEGAEVNVSALETEALLFAVMDDVPLGKYTKLLVAVKSVRVEGGPCEELETKIPDNEMKLVPDEPIEIGPGDTIVIRLAMDSDKSVQITVDGETDTCIFRPVVDVDISKVGDADCPTSVEGEVIQLLLNLQFVPVGMVIDLGDSRGEQDVLFGDETAFFDDSGLPTEATSIGVGDTVVVKGELDDDGALAARVVIQGAVAVVSGIVVEDAERGIFVMLPDDDLAVVGRTPVEIFDGTQILLDCVEATPEVIVEGARVIVTGKIAVGERSLRAASVLVNPAVLVGELTAIATTTGGWNITMIPEGAQSFRIVGVPAKVGFHLQGDGRIPADLLTDLVDCESRHVRVYLDPDAKDDVATEVRIGAEDFRGFVEDVDVDKRLLLIGEMLVDVRGDATILDLRDGQKLISLADIEYGDLVRAFGLDACPDDSVDSRGVNFHGFVLLVLPEEDKPRPPEHGDEGCHYNKWKKNVDRWPARYGPRTFFADVFDDVFPGKTLFDVIDTKGGELNHLGRETVAALLNAASNEVEFALTVDEVIRKFNAIDHDDGKGAVKDLRKEFHALTEGPCPLDDKEDDDRDDD